MAEKRIQLEEPGEFSKLIQEINSKWCQILANPPYEINVDIIREFYSNAKLVGENEMLERTSLVRGRQTPYDWDAIHDWLEDAFELLEGGFDAFSWEVHGNNWNYDRIVVYICTENEIYEIDWLGKPIQLKNSNITMEAQMWIIFLLHNVTPKLNTSSKSLQMAQLIWFIITQHKVDMARIISNKIWAIVN